jgi:hypothetical protein
MIKSIQEKAMSKRLNRNNLFSLAGVLFLLVHFALVILVANDFWAILAAALSVACFASYFVCEGKNCENNHSR